jgi:sugar lactone lactonase YvrE
MSATRRSGLTPMASSPRVVLDSLAFGESPRWHDGRLYVSDWGAGEVLALEADGSTTVAARASSFPLCFDFLPDGRMLLVTGTTILRQEADGRLVTHTDLSGVWSTGGNDIVVDDRGNAYVNTVGFDFPGGEFRPGNVALVRPDGTAEVVAEGLAFPNGMAVSPDGATLLVAESYGNVITGFDIGADGRLSGRRVWAALGEDNPDGICVDAEGAVWYADVPHAHCVRVAEGGEVLQSVPLDRGGFACALGGPERRTLFVVTNRWGPQGAGEGRHSQVVALEVEVPGAGHP